MGNLSSIERVIEAYCNLRALDPKNELLEYFYFRENGLRLNPIPKIKTKFFEKFKGRIEVPDFDKIEEYQNALWENIMRNYATALENEVRDFIEK